MNKGRLFGVSFEGEKNKGRLFGVSFEGEGESKAGKGHVFSEQ